MEGERLRKADTIILSNLHIEKQGPRPATVGDMSVTCGMVRVQVASRRGAQVLGVPARSQHCPANTGGKYGQF